MSKCTSLLFLIVSIVCFLLASSSAVEASIKCTFPSQRIQCGDLTCNKSSGTCMPCANASQCYNPGMICEGNTAGSWNQPATGKCKIMSFADLFHHRPGGAVGSMLVAVFVCAIAVIGGVGGGGVLVPMFQVLLGIPLLDAVALSQATIVGQSTFNVFLQVQRFHPQYQPPRPTRPLVNYPLLAFWLPLSLLGTQWGNLIGKLVPDWFRLVLLFLLLTQALVRMVKRTCAQRAEDEAQKGEAQNRSVSSVAGTSRTSQTNKQQEEDEEDEEEEDESDDEEGFLRSNLSPAKRKEYLINDSQADVEEGEQEEEKEQQRRSRKNKIKSIVFDATARSGLLSHEESRASTKPKRPKHLQEQEEGEKENLDGGESESQIKSPAALVSAEASSSSSTIELKEKGKEEEEEAEQQSSSTEEEKKQRDARSLTRQSVGIFRPDEEEEQQEEENKFPQFPVFHYVFIFGLTFIPLLLCNLTKNRLVDCGSPVFWFITISSTIYNLSLALWYRNKLSKINDRIQVGDAEPDELPFKWNPETTVYFPFLAATAGAAASLLGIGGGLILGVLFVEAGLVPEAASATSGFATFAVAAASLLQFVIQGKLSADWGFVFICAGLVATTIGQLVLMPEIKKRGWKFVIFGSLSFIMGGSMLALTSVGIYDTVELVDAGGSLGFGEMCKTAVFDHAGSS